MMTQLEMDRRTTAQAGKVLYTAKTHTTGGRENGACRSPDGHLDVRLSLPGSARIGTNPEQLLAPGWSACFEGAIALAARERRIALPADLAIDAEVDLHCEDGGYSLGTRLNISLSSIERSVAQTWWTRRTGSARTRRPRAAASTSRSSSSEPETS